VKAKDKMNICKDCAQYTVNEMPLLTLHTCGKFLRPKKGVCCGCILDLKKLTNLPCPQKKW
jgi:hypothetical protein